MSCLTQSSFGDRWSCEKHLLGKTTAFGNSVGIECPAPEAVPLKLVLYATQAPDYATLRFQVHGENITKAFNAYATDVQPAPAFVLGTFTPRDGKFILRVEVAGANPTSKGAKYF